MKRIKKIGLLIFVGVLLIGCGPTKINANKKLMCYLTSEMDNQKYRSDVVITFNSDGNKVVEGIFTTKYSNLEKTNSNNDILADLINRQSKVEQIEGVAVTLDVSDTSFNYEEKWSYQDVEIKEAVEADENQLMFIDNREYSIDLIKDYYTKKGYSCDISKL